MTADSMHSRIPAARVAFIPYRTPLLALLALLASRSRFSPRPTTHDKRFHDFSCTAYTHGVVIFNTLHAAAALAGVPLRDLVRDRYARLLWAAMIREGLQVWSKYCRRVYLASDVWLIAASVEFLKDLLYSVLQRES